MSEVVDLIKKYGLYHQISRDLPLFPISFIGPAYTVLTGKIYGISYRAVGAIGKKDKLITLLNKKEIAEETEKILNSDFNNIFNIKLPKAKKFFEELRKRVKLASNLQPKESLKIITEIYSNYWAYFVIYNSIMRYLGNEENKGSLTKETIKKLSQDRDSISKIYLAIENIVASKTKELGNKFGFDGNLLKYMTKSEIKEFLENGEVDFKELKRRTEGYVYLFIRDSEKEYIISDKEVIENVKDLFKVSGDINLVKGHTAHPGKIRGIVRNLSTHKNKKIDKDTILVTSMTSPNDTILIGKCSALITDEGGILSHAAIISRELGIPCIIGTKIATKVLKDGDLVEVDADKGVVRKIEK